MDNKRKIQQVAAVALGSELDKKIVTVALCNDGTVWSIKPDGDCRWSRFPDIPQSDFNGDQK
jgi:hypothetical protein